MERFTKVNTMSVLEEKLVIETKTPKCLETPAPGRYLEGRRARGLETKSIEPELRTDVPNCKEAWVTGSPFRDAKDMNYHQGRNKYNAMGNCGLVSISNSLRRQGVDISEDEVTRMGITSGNVIYKAMGDPCDNGGTSLESRKRLLDSLGYKNETGRPYGHGGDLEDIADAIDSGKSVVLSVNADLLWEQDMGSPTLFGMSFSNHCVTVTGIARDAKTGKIAGVYIADSGRGIPEDACRYLDVDKFHEVYTGVINSGANIIDSVKKGVSV